MEVINFIEEHWRVLGFLFSEIGIFLLFVFAMIQAVKCLLRNDILAIYDRCKDKEEITYWQLQAVEHSYRLYRILRGNSFILDLMKRIRNFKIIDKIY